MLLHSVNTKMIYYDVNYMISVKDKIFLKLIRLYSYVSCNYVCCGYVSQIVSFNTILIMYKSVTV